MEYSSSPMSTNSAENLDVIRETSPDTTPDETVTTPPRTSISSSERTPTQASVLASRKQASRKTHPVRDVLSPKTRAMLQRRTSHKSVPKEVPKETMEEYHDYIFITEEPIETNKRHFEIAPNFRWALNSFFLASRKTHLGRRAGMSGFDMLFDLLPGAKNRFIVQRLHEFLCLRDDSPLYLYFRLREWTLDDFLKEVLDVLCQHVDRFRHIDIQTNEVFATQFFASLTPAKADNLDLLKFDTRSFSFEADQAIFSFANALPNVETIIYPYRARTHWHLTDVSAAVWSNLSSVNISDVVDQAMCIVLMEQCIRATHITIQCISDVICHIPAHTPRTVLPLLQSLDIGISHIDTTSILDRLTCPALDSLEFTTVSKPEISPERLQAFLQRCASPLRFLNIFDCQADLELTIPLIRAVLISGSRLRHKKRKRVETFSLFTRSLPTERNQVFAAWNKLKNQEGAINAPDLQFWCGEMSHPEKAMRIGWGDRPFMLDPLPVNIETTYSETSYSSDDDGGYDTPRPSLGGLQGLSKLRIL